MTLRLRHPHVAHGFTLVELLISSALLTVLLLAGAATASLVRRAGMSQVGDSSLALALAMHALRRDIECATSVGPVSSLGVSMKVPDRTGDGNVDTIAYTWSGVAGAPLTRSINGGTPTAIVATLQSFAANADLTTLSVPSDDQPIPPSSQTVGSCIASSNLNAIPCSSNLWIAVAFSPSLPVDTKSWTLNSVRLSLCRNGPPDGTFAVQIRPTNGQVPTSTVLASITVSESSLGTSFADFTYSFTGLSGLSPTSPLAIVLLPISGNNVAKWRFTTSNAAVKPGDAMYQSSNSGSSWTLKPQQEPLFSVTGTPSASSPVTVSAQVVRIVRVSAEAIRGVTAAFEVEARGYGAASGSAMGAGASSP